VVAGHPVRGRPLAPEGGGERSRGARPPQRAGVTPTSPRRARCPRAPRHRVEVRPARRLITPPGGEVLDPFAGSGSTVLAALAEGCFDAFAIEADAGSVATALRRAQGIDPLFHGVPARAAG
jgi:hypothetical protein